jgi:hypothetical protein
MLPPLVFLVFGAAGFGIIHYCYEMRRDVIEPSRTECKKMDEQEKRNARKSRRSLIIKKKDSKDAEMNVLKRYRGSIGRLPVYKTPEQAEDDDESSDEEDDEEEDEVLEDQNEEDFNKENVEIKHIQSITDLDSPIQQVRTPFSQTGPKATAKAKDKNENRPNTHPNTLIHVDSSDNRFGDI